MKSLKESFSIWSHKPSAPALGPMPKSAVGLLPHSHREEQQIAKLWSEMLKSEQGCRNAVLAVRQYSEKAAAVQHDEERLLAKLQDIAAGQTSADLHNALNALDNLLPQVRDSVPEATERLESEVSHHVREYHALYVNVDNLRIKRDKIVADLNAIQDRIEKLRLKGKRSTDVLVEKERALKQLQEIQSQLLQDVAAFHNMRAAFLLHAVHNYVDTQFLQYGSQAQQYKTHVVGGSAHHPNLTQVNQSTEHHLSKLRALNITDA